MGKFDFCLQQPDLVKKFIESIEKLTLGIEILGLHINYRIARFVSLINIIEKDEDVFANDSPLYFSDKEKNDITTKLQGKLYGKRYVKVVLLKIDEKISSGTASYNYPIISI